MLPKALKNQSQHVPNSIAHKNAQLENAKSTLIKAKSLNRPVRKAKPNECAFSRERDLIKTQTKSINESETYESNGLLSIKQVLKITNLSRETIRAKRLDGILPFVKRGSNFFYKEEDLLKIQNND